MQRVDDSTLFVRWLEERDGEAFTELARRHSAVVFDLAARAMGDRVAAEDVVQEALLDLALERTRKPIEVGIPAWLVRYAVCRARNRRASEVSRARRQRVVGGRREEDVMPDESFELHDELEHVLDHARPEERVVLAMRYLHEWDYGRIAGALSISEGAARVRVHRALAGVRERLAGSTPGDERRLMAGLAALPVFELDPTRLQTTIRSVLETATAELGPAAPAPGTAVAGPWTRVARYGLQLGLGLTLVAASGTPTTPGRLRTADLTGRFAPLEHVEALAAGDDLAVDAQAGTWALEPGVSPRPGDWDEGALRRLARGETELRVRRTSGRRSGALPPSETPVPEVLDPFLIPSRTADAPPGPSRTSRPTSQGACAARCEPVSSVDERAGVQAGPSRAAGAGLPASEVDSDAVVPETTAPADTRQSGATPDARLLVERGAVAVRDLPPDEVEAVVEAVEAVERLVLAEIGGSAGSLVELASDRTALKRAQRRTGRAYRQLRREMRRAALSRDDAGVASAAAKAARLTTVNQVLALLVEAAGRPATSFEDFRWPDGLDVRAALDEVLAVLGGAPEESAPGTEEPSDPAGVVVETSGAGTLSLDRLPDALR